MDPVTVIVWIFVVVFLLTAIITIGGIVENFKFIQVSDKYLKGLYVALLLEITAAAITVATGALEQDRKKLEQQLKNAQIEISRLQQVNQDLLVQLNEQKKHEKNVSDVTDAERVVEVYLPPKKKLPLVYEKFKVEGRYYIDGKLHRKKTSILTRGQDFLVYYNSTPGGRFGNDFGRCTYKNDGYIIATAKDSVKPMSDTGGDIEEVGDISRAKHGPSACECEILKGYSD